MVIKALNVYTKNRRIKPKVESLEMVANKGVLNDKSFGLEAKQVRILNTNVRNWIDSTEIRGLCFSRFNEHIVIETADNEPVLPVVGGVIEIGDVKLEITEVGKGCFSECEREQKHLGCMLRDQCFYARVIDGGILNVGMTGIFCRD